MLAFVLSLAGVLVVGGLLFLGGSLLLGRGETQPPAETDRSPVELPDDRPVVAEDIRALRISVAVRGYRMTEVDWLLDQFAATLDERDEEITALRAELERRTPAPGSVAGAPASAEPAGDEHPVEEGGTRPAPEPDGARSDA